MNISGDLQLAADCFEGVCYIDRRDCHEAIDNNTVSNNGVKHMTGPIIYTAGAPYDMNILEMYASFLCGYKLPGRRQITDSMVA